MPRLRSFRLVCREHEKPLVESLLRAEGYDFEPESFSPWCRVLTAEPQPLGHSLAATFGYIYIQDRSSMLPPVVLDPPEGAAVLDMCASPGSKTGFLAQLVGPNGCVIGNEPGNDRLGTLRQNLRRLNLHHTCTCSYPGERMPLEHGCFDQIMLDPPCSGWGTVEKHPEAAKLWTGEKTGPLIALQRKLLEKAASILRPGGVVVYSTCTTNPEENEQQAAWAKEELGLEPEYVTAPEGFQFEKHGGAGLRVDGEASGAQGFYIVRLRKTGAEQPDEVTENRFASMEIERESLALPKGVEIDWAQLGNGLLADFRGRLMYIPRQACTLPPAFKFQGFPLGKLNSKGRKLDFKPTPGIRLMMPHESGNGINTDDTDFVRALLSGRTVDSEEGGTGLYYQGLPLGRIKRKGKRALWSA